MLDKNSESRVHVEAIEEPPPPGKSIAFGLERMGLIAVKAPILSMIILVVLIVAAMFGIQRIKIDNSLSQLFRSNSKDYKQYEAVTKRFPATEFDVLVVVEGKTLLARENLEKIRDMVTDLQLVEGVRGLVSLFSARQAPEPGKLPAALFPPELPRRRRLRQVRRDRQSQRDHSRQAAVGGRHAGADRAVARTESRFLERSRQGGRRDPEDHGRRSRRAAGSTRSCPAFRSCSSRSATRSSATG